MAQHPHIRTFQQLLDASGNKAQIEHVWQKLETFAAVHNLQSFEVDQSLRWDERPDSRPPLIYLWPSRSGGQGAVGIALKRVSNEKKRHQLLQGIRGFFSYPRKGTSP